MASYVLSQFARHFLVSIYGVLIAAVIGIPVGLAIAHHRTLSNTVIGIAQRHSDHPQPSDAFDHHAGTRTWRKHSHCHGLLILAAANHQEHLHRHAKCR